MEAIDFLRIKQKVCKTHRNCVKCEFYYGCTQISNATEKNMIEAIQSAKKLIERGE